MIAALYNTTLMQILEKVEADDLQTLILDLAILLAALSSVFIIYVINHRRAAKILKDVEASLTNDANPDADAALDAELQQAIEAAGYAYDPVQDIFYSSLNPWQRNMGYCSLYDEACAPMSMIIDCEPICFDYNGKRWMIEFWKGQYGMTTGCEIGIYSTGEPELDIPGFFKGFFYSCASDDELLYMAVTLYKNGQALFTRKGMHWWLTGFMLGEFSEPLDLSMVLHISFRKRKMRDAFVKGLKEAGYSKAEFYVYRSTVSLTFQAPHTPQPYTRSPESDWIIQRKNELLCKTYRDITKPYKSFPDKVNAVKEQAPELFDTVLNIGKNRKLFEVYERMKEYLS